jgi:hypothetical protein
MEVTLRTQNLVRTRLLYKQLESQHQILEARVREQTLALAQVRVEIMERLAVLAEYRARASAASRPADPMAAILDTNDTTLGKGDME